MSADSNAASNLTCSIQSRRRLRRTIAAVDPEQPGSAVHPRSADAVGRAASEGNRWCTRTSAGHGETAPATGAKKTTQRERKSEPFGFVKRCVTGNHVLALADPGRAVARVLAGGEV
jgi:hypothetical protein